MTRALRDVRDPELAQRRLEDEGVYVESWSFDPATRVMSVESPTDPHQFEYAAIRADLHVAISLTSHAAKRQAGVR